MALTLGTPTVDQSGLYLTIPINGATLPLKPSNNISGFIVIVNGVAVETYYDDTEGPRGTSQNSINLTVRTPIATTDTVTLEVIDSNLTDSAGTPNTLANVTTPATVTNNSTLAVDAHNYSTIGTISPGTDVPTADFDEKTNDPNAGS